MAFSPDELKILKAFVLMSEDFDEGVSYKEFIKDDLIHDANYLIKKGYARKIPSLSKDAEDTHYCLTERGRSCLGEIGKYSLNGIEKLPEKTENSKKTLEEIQ